MDRDARESRAAAPEAQYAALVAEVTRVLRAAASAADAPEAPGEGASQVGPWNAHDVAMMLGAGASAEQLADYLHVQEAAVAPAPRSRAALAPTAGALLRVGHEVWGRVRPA